jgi:hypothetical protein
VRSRCDHARRRRGWEEKEGEDRESAACSIHSYSTIGSAEWILGYRAPVSHQCRQTGNLTRGRAWGKGWDLNSDALTNVDLCLRFCAKDNMRSSDSRFELVIINGVVVTAADCG